MSKEMHDGSYGYSGQEGSETWFIGIRPPISKFMVYAIADVTTLDWQVDPEITDCTLYVNENGSSLGEVQRKLLDVEKRLGLFGITVLTWKNGKAINMDKKATPFEPDPEDQPAFEEARPRRRRTSGLPLGL